MCTSQLRCFAVVLLAIIALLRNAAQQTIVVKAELDEVRKQNIDITNVNERETARRRALRRQHRQEYLVSMC